MSKTAFVFPGQGAQKVGMGREFFERDSHAEKMFYTASELLGLNMANLCFEPGNRLDQTEYTQPALLTVSLAMARAANERGLVPDVTAGLSLGEYCAIVQAKAMSFEDAVTVVRKRGILMENAVPDGAGAMAAVLGMDVEMIQNVLARIPHVYIANYNCPGQIVITGSYGAVNVAGQKLKEAGARRVMPLKVSGPFHSPMLKEAGEELREILNPVQLKELAVPYVSNVTGAYVTDSSQIKELLSQQVASSVQWQQSIECMIADGADTFIEIGPGKTLSGFIRKISRDVRIYNIETWEDMETVTGELVC